TTTPLGVFGISLVLLLSLAAAIAYAVRVPAAPAANWTIRMAWQGDERRYLNGVKRAAHLLFALVLTLLLPLHVALLGVAAAAWHSLFSLFLAALALDALFLSYRKLPFACGYVPIENPKLVWPASFAALLFVTYRFASIERSALRTSARALALTAA